MGTPGTPSANSLYQIDQQFTGSDGPCPFPVFLLPPQFQYGKSPTITFNVPWLYIGGSTLPGGTSNDDFTLTVTNTGSGTPTQATVDVGVAIANNNVWKCAPAARAALMANFVSLLEWIEQDLELNGNLVPGSTMRIAAALADNIPAPLNETLFYRYGLSPGFAAGTIPYVDIRPGMRLRVETSASQFIAPGSTLNGYIATGRFEYDVSSVPPSGMILPAVAFDPFLGAIATPAITEASPVTAGGIIDLQAVGGAQAYWRLIYPATMTPPNQSGDAAILDNVAMIGAPSYNALQTATSGYPSVPASPDTTALFLGRSVIVPEIPIWLTLRQQTDILYVPVGTTVANIVERYTSVSLNPQQNVISTMNRVTTATPSGNSLAVQFYPSTASSIDPRIYQLPLIAGDNITLNF